MEFKRLGVSNSSLWFLVSLFLFFWLGQQLIDAVTNLEIQNLRTTDLLHFDESPAWFTIVVAFKSLAWLISALIIYKYIHNIISTKNI
jgi:hypothetical protein